MHKQTLEKIFFIFINFLFSTLGKFIVVGFELFVLFILRLFLEKQNLIITNTDISLTKDTIGVGLTMSYFLFKGIAFLILYRCKKQFPYIHSFFDKLRTDRKFMWKILGIALLLDIIGCLCYLHLDYYIILILFIINGLIFNYLIFLLFFPPVRRERIAQDGSIIDSKLRNVFSKIIIWLNLILISIIFFVCTLTYITALRESYFLFDFPPPQVIETAEQNQIHHVRHDRGWSEAYDDGFEVYIGKYKNTKEEECIMFDGKEAHVCDIQEHGSIFLILD